MSRPFTSQDWADSIVEPRKRDVEDFERLVSYVRKQAYYEGLTHHLRPGRGGTPFHECPFCSEEVPDSLTVHLVLCEEVPEHLRSPL